jgi:hypothetical protein
MFNNNTVILKAEKTDAHAAIDLEINLVLILVLKLCISDFILVLKLCISDFILVLKLCISDFISKIRNLISLN